LVSAINRINTGQDSFYTIDASTGRQVDIEVVREAGKQPFLRTRTDGKWKDNLLTQHECGANCKVI
jgi:hypothetical protein